MLRENVMFSFSPFLFPQQFCHGFLVLACVPISALESKLSYAYYVQKNKTMVLLLRKLQKLVIIDEILKISKIIIIK